MDSGWTFCPMASSLLLRRERDREVAGALADARRPAQGAGAEALQRRALVGADGVDPQLVADELVVVLGVCHGRLEQLAPVAGDRARRVREDRAGLDDGLGANVVADEPGLTGRRAYVLGLGADDRSITGRTDALGARPGRLGGPGRLGLGGLGLGGLLGLLRLGLLRLELLRLGR